MGYKLILAEKPSVAASIAKVVGATTPHREKANGYLEGNGYKVSWAFGHLVTLDRPEDMGFPGTQLPIFPEEWKTHIIQSTNGDSAALVTKQMKYLERLFNGAEEIIVATDAGREGELIFRYIYEYIKCKTPFCRLWISSLTDEAIEEGMSNLREGKEMEPLSQAAHARSEADYLVGFNASRALRLASGYKGNLSLGRVQTPVLCMICDRYEANKNFVPTPYWQIQASVHKDMMNFEVLTKRKYNKESDAKEDSKRVELSKRMRVISVEKKQVVSKPPLLYDLTSLQRAANSKFGLTAEETLRIAQSLYEKKFLSYPRTGSRYIPQDVYKTIPSLIKRLASYDRFAKSAAELDGKRLCRKSVDDTKITDHHALLPTPNIPTGLTGNEKLIWEMIAGRTIEAFGEDSLADKTTVELDCQGVRFVATGSVITKEGWKGVFGADASQEEKKGKDDKESEGAVNAKLPNLIENEILNAGGIKTIRKTDSAPAIYTDSSLLGDMETCGKKIEDEELREAMKDVGLGTPATRAAVIETLITRKYIVRESKKIIPTSLGTTIAKTVKGRKIANVETTGEWEKELGLIERGKVQKKDFDAKIKDYVLEIIEDLKSNCKGFEGMEFSNEPVRTCPICGKQMKNYKYSITCDEKADGCGFKINRTIAGKTLPDSAINALAEGKQTALLKGFTSKSGKKFDCRLGVNKQEKNIEFILQKALEGPKMEGMVCPCCGGNLQDEKWKLSCECGFALSKSQCGVQLKEEQIRTLLSGGKTYLRGMVAKSGKKFNATLKINTKDKKMDFIFDK